MAKPALPTASITGTTLVLNSSNHPDIGPDGLVIRNAPTPIPNATPSLLDYLRGLGVAIVEPLAVK